MSASDVLAVEFISAESALRTLLPFVVGLLLLALLAQLVLQLLRRGRRQRYEPGAVRDYGVLGGTVCPRCRRPFALSALGINLLVGKLQRCPYYGKWSILWWASPQALAAAEAGPAAGPCCAERRGEAAPAGGRFQIPGLSSAGTLLAALLAVLRDER